MINQFQHTSLSQTMAQMRRRYNTRSSGGSDTPYNGYDPSPPPTSGMPPVADLRGDRFVALETMDDSTGTSIARARFNGSYSYDPDDGTDRGEGITNYSWNFPGGDPNHVEGETKSTVSTEYTTVGDKIVTLTVTDNDDPAESSAATATVTVLKLSLDKPETITRGDAVPFRAIIEPSGLNLNPTFSWKYTVGAWSTTANTGKSNTWAGQMVADGTMEFTATIGSDSFTHSEKINITPRPWADVFPALPTPEATDTNPLPVPPTETTHLGHTHISYPLLPNTLIPRTVPMGGPNEGWVFILRQPTTLPWSHKAYINPDLEDTNSLFYIVNHRNQPVGYMDKLLENVIIHEGILEQKGYESHAGKALEWLRKNKLNPWAESEIVHSTTKTAKKHAADVLAELDRRLEEILVKAGKPVPPAKTGWHPLDKYPLDDPSIPGHNPHNPDNIPVPIFPR